MQSLLLEEMADQQIKIDIAALKKSVADTDDRSRRLGENFESLRNSLHLDFNGRLSRVEERSQILLVVITIGVTAILASVIQLYSLNGRLSGVESDVKNMSGTLGGLKLKQIGDNPTDPKNIVEAKQILTQAKGAKVKLPADVVKSEGAKFIDAAQRNPDAWSAVIEFVNYNSFLNFDPASISGARVSLANKFTAYQPPSSAGPVWALGDSKPPEVPQLRPLDQRDLNDGKTYGPKFLKIVGGEVLLDGYYIKNVILENVHVSYRGGAMRLENVYFVNCTFDIPQQQNGERLAMALLEPSSATNLVTS